MSGSDIAPVTSLTFNGLVEAVDVSSNGDFIAAVTSSGELAYWKNARANFQSQWTWKATVQGEAFNDVAVSDDGNYIAVSAGAVIPGTVYYWAGATGLAANPPPTWSSETGSAFYSVDMSSDGNSVIAGAVITESSGAVYFWGGARGLTGTPNPTWTYTTDKPVLDVAIDDAGDYMAACTSFFTTVYFFDNTGSLKWSYAEDADKLSISRDGGTLALGTPGPVTVVLLNTGFHTVGAPVGGFIEPVNKLSIIAPYVALFGAIATVAFVVAKPWKKPKD